MEPCCFVSLFGYVPLLVVRVRWVAVDASTCGVCDYDRTGLAEGALCPECGTDPNATQIVERRFQVNKERLGRLAGIALVGLLLVVACLLVPSVAEDVLAWRVRRIGYSSDVAARYAAYRVSTMPRELPFMAPYIFLLLSPMAVLLPARPRMWKLLALIAAGIVAWQITTY